MIKIKTYNTTSYTTITEHITAKIDVIGDDDLSCVEDVKQGCIPMLNFTEWDGEKETFWSVPIELVISIEEV